MKPRKILGITLLSAVFCALVIPLGLQVGFVEVLLILFGATVVAGAILLGVYSLTSE